MEDFPLLILFFIIYLVASASSGKKKKKNRAAGRRGPMRSSAQGEQMDVRAQRREQQTMEGFQTAFASHADPDRCAQDRIHLHAVTNTQLQHAAEGEDPCHVGGVQDTMDAHQEAFAQDEARQDYRQDILRGVIMSEILMRPHERRAMQRSRQRTNGY